MGDGRKRILGLPDKSPQLGIHFEFRPNMFCRRGVDLVEEVLDQQILFDLVDHNPSFKQSRSRSSPRRIRALMGPSGVSSRSAICSWVNPPKKESSSACRCSSGISRRAE